MWSAWFDLCLALSLSFPLLEVNRETTRIIDGVRGGQKTSRSEHTGLFRFCSTVTHVRAILHALSFRFDTSK